MADPPATDGDDGTQRSGIPWGSIVPVVVIVIGLVAAGAGLVSLRGATGARDDADATQAQVDLLDAQTAALTRSLESVRETLGTVRAEIQPAIDAAAAHGAEARDLSATLDGVDDGAGRLSRAIDAVIASWNDMDACIGESDRTMAGDRVCLEAHGAAFEEAVAELQAATDAIGSAVDAADAAIGEARR